MTEQPYQKSNKAAGKARRNRKKKQTKVLGRREWILLLPGGPLIICGLLLNCLHGVYQWWDYFLCLIFGVLIVNKETSIRIPRLKRPVKIGSWILVGVAVLFLVDETIETNNAENHGFSLRTPTTISSTFWILTDHVKGFGSVISPMDFCPYVQFTNTTQSDFTIDKYWFDQKKKMSNETEKIEAIDVQNGTPLIVMNGNFEHARVVMFKNLFNDAVTNKSIAESETISGWICLKAPPDGIAQPIMHIETIDGREYSEPIILAPPNGGPQESVPAQGAVFALGLQVNVSNLPKLYYETAIPIK